LYDDIISIKSLINIDVDEFSCSMSKFISLKKRAIQKHNQLKTKRKAK